MKVVKKLVDLNIFYFTQFYFLYKEYAVISDTSITLGNKKKYNFKSSAEPELSISYNYLDVRNGDFKIRIYEFYEDFNIQYNSDGSGKTYSLKIGEGLKRI